jgi:hypothetical protein
VQKGNAGTRTPNGARTSLRQSKLHRGIITTTANRKHLKATQETTRQHNIDDESDETNDDTSKNITRKSVQFVDRRSNNNTWGGGRNCDPLLDQNKDAPPKPHEQENANETAKIDDPRERTPIRVGFVIEGKKTICPITAIKRFIKIITQAEPNTTFHPAEGKTGPSFRQIDDAPNSETAFKQFFVLHEHVKRPGYSAQHEICLNICTDRPLTTIKGEGNNTKMVQELQKGRIHVDTDKFHTQRIVGAGGLFGIHPRALQRQALTQELTDKLSHATLYDSTRAAIRRNSKSDQDEDDDWEVDAREIATLTLSCRKFSYGATNRITTEAIAIECAEDDAKLLQARLAAAMTQDLMPKGLKYIPRAAAKHMGEDDYLQLLKDQTAMMRRSVSVPISGLTAAAMSHRIDISDDNGFTTTMTLKQAIEQHPKIHRVEPTNDTQNGKWLLITDRRFESNIQQYVDEQLHKYFLQLPDGPEWKTEKWHTPSRTDKPYANEEETRVYNILKTTIDQSMTDEDDTTTTYKRTNNNNKRKHGAIQFKQMTYASVASRMTNPTEATTFHTLKAPTNQDRDPTQTTLEYDSEDSHNGDSRNTPQLRDATNIFTQTMETRMTQWMTKVEQKIESQQPPDMNALLQAMQQTIQNTVKDLLTTLATETFKTMENRMATNEKKWETANLLQQQEISTLQDTIKQLQNSGTRSPSRLPPPMASRLNQTNQTAGPKEPSGSS